VKGLSEFLSLSSASVKSSLRSGGELFWNVIFMILIFLVFNSASFERRPVKVFLEGVKDPGGVEIFENPEDADAVVKLQGSTIVVTYKNPDEVVRMNIRSVVWRIKEKLERGNMNRRVSVKEVVLGKKIDYKAFISSGILTMVLFSTGAFGAVKVLSLYKYRGILKMFYTFPLKKFLVYTALSTGSLIQAILGTSLILAFSGAFGINFNLNAGLFFLSFAIVFLTSYAIGVVFSLIFRTPKAASGIMSALYTIMPFFSGVYFPVEFLPNSIRWISYLMPMKYMVELMRKTLI
jgi:ABC-2 type transport system permease protein